ncbi:hypothetical protein AB833_08435 [Chromatiales bacterium (ex Bugula neritina AB1)]|nr:hypothetical protein AB833_08435 [Chromatiales bacterium (ex Bugula neritina AB1)]
MCPAGITDARSLSVPYLPKPGVNIPYTDPALGATVVRITDSKFAEVRKPAYSTIQAWNADESLMILYKSGNSGSGHELRDGHSYELIRQLNFSPADIEEFFWSHSNPNELFYVSSAQKDFGHFKRFYPATNESETIAEFGNWCGNSLPVAGRDVHMQSYNDDTFGFRCQSKNGNPIMFSYRISTGESVIEPIGDGTQWTSNTAPISTPSGTQFWYQGKTLNKKLQYQAITLDIKSYIEHSSIGTTVNGQDALYQVAYDPSPDGCNGDSHKGIGHLVQHNLDSGRCRNIISQQHGYPYPTSSTHISALASEAPGTVAMSSIGTRKQTVLFSNGKPAPALFSEVYIANTDTDQPVICRLAHHRSFGKNATKGGYAPYFGEPHATISPSGTRILFGSDWYNSGSVDSYVIELPGYKKSP